MRVRHRWFALILLGLSALVSSAWAAPSQTLDPVNILFSPDCTTPYTLNLGSLSVSLADNMTWDFDAGKPAASTNSPLMQATFTVSAAAQASGIWSCMSLHYLQEITQDDCPAKLNGVPLPRAGHSVIDPPNGGWDYQQPKGDDNLPWYWNAAEEAKYFQMCKSYFQFDAPAYCPSPGTTSFTTFLVAEVTGSICDSTQCLKPGEILLLAGWDWMSRRPGDGGSTLSAIRTPTAADVASFTDALSEANFADWTVVRDKAICCPEPATLVLVVAFGPLALVGRRRRLDRAA